MCGTHGLQEIQCAAHVVPIVAFWLLYRLPYEGQRCEMQHAIESHCKHRIQRFFIQQITFNEVSSCRHSLDVSFREIIKNSDLVACCEQLDGHDTADVPSSTCDEKFHCATSAPAAGWKA